MFFFGKGKRRAHSSAQPNQSSQGAAFSPSLKTNLDAVKQLLRGSSDLTVRPLRSPLAPDVVMTVVYVTKLVDDAMLNEHVLRPLMSSPIEAEVRSDQLVQLIGERVIEVGSAAISRSPQSSASYLLDGYCLLLIQEAACGLLVDISAREQRSVSEPSAETVVRGPQISFNEALHTNINLLRHMIRSPNLYVEELEGQIAIVVDGSPFALLAPVTLFQLFQSPEDYYNRFDIATFLRLIRFAAFLISMTLPALYIAVTTFHQEMLPTTLLITLAAQREGIPFPGLVEALLMELTFEVLREAGVRMPRAIGPAISIVGALVLGQAAVEAGIVSAGMVIIVSFTAICNFVIPQLNVAIAARLIRFSFMLLAGVFGLMGMIAGVLAVMIHLVRLESFGVPYMSPLAPFHWAGLKDTLIRAPLQKLIGREPRNIFSRNSKSK